MRTLLLLLAAIGLPICALAQTVADDGKPTVVPELAVEGSSGQCPVPPHVWGPNRLFDAPTRAKIKRTQESAGTRGLVLMLVAGARNGDIDYTHIQPGLAKAIRAQSPRLKPAFVCLGVLKEIRFRHVSQADFDDYEVDFSNGVLEWAVKPFDSHQLTAGIIFRYFSPEPATRQLETLLKSLGQGRPNYSDLTADAASRLQARWPALQKSLKDWGQLRGLRFVRQGDDGADVFVAVHEHRQVVWTTSPPNAAGKFTDVRYDERVG